MKLIILPDAEAAARQAARMIADAARHCIVRSGRFTLAVSGGSTPLTMLGYLGKLPMSWDGVEIFQVDERIAPRDDADRNFTGLEQKLVKEAKLPPQQIHPMPVEKKFAVGMREYVETITRIAGDPPVLDLVHLGLGADGHTASLLPDDNILDSQEIIAISREYQGRRRMSMTYPLLNNARKRLWLVTGDSKKEMLRRLYDGDKSIPAGRVQRDNTVIITDRDAAAELENNVGES